MSTASLLLFGVWNITGARRASLSWPALHYGIFFIPLALVARVSSLLMFSELPLNSSFVVTPRRLQRQVQSITLRSPKPKLNSELKMWRYMNSEISGLRTGGAGTPFSCLHLCNNRRLMLTVNRKKSGWLIEHELTTFFAVEPCNTLWVFSIFESCI